MSRLDYRRKKQREAERLERGENAFISFVKTRKELICLVLIILLIGAAAIVIGTNPNFRGHFSNNDETLYLDENTIFEMPYITQEKTVIKTMNNSVIICSREKVVALSELGKQQWEIPVSLNEPLLSVSGDYIVAADRGGRDIYLINGGKLILQTLSQYSIINAKASSDGKFIIISDEPYFKGLVSVIDAKNNEVFVWHSGSSYIIDASIGDDVNKLAVAVVNTTSSETETANSVSSGVLMFNLYETQPYTTHTLEDCLITNVYKADKGFMAVTDKKVVSLGASGELSGEFSYGGRSVNKIYKSDSMLVLSLEESGGRKSIDAIDNRGKKMCSIDVRQTPNFISAQSDRLAYGGGSDIVVCENKGKELYLIQTIKKFNSLTLLGTTKKAVGITGTSIDIIEIK